MLVYNIPVSAQSLTNYDRVSFEQEIDWLVSCDPTECELGRVYHMISAFDIQEPDISFSELKQLCNRRLFLVEHQGEVIGAASFILKDGVYCCNGYKNLRPYANTKLQQTDEDCILIIDQEVAVMTQNGVDFLMSSIDPTKPYMTFADYMLCVSCENEMKDRGPRLVGQENLGRYDAEDLQFAKRFWNFPQWHGRKITSGHVYGSLAMIIAVAVGIVLLFKHRKKRKGEKE